MKLSQWLTKQYGAFITESSVYVDEVRRLFGLTESKYRGNNRWRHYDDYGLNWIRLEEGMEQLVVTLREKLQAGMPTVVAAPIVEFYRLLKEHIDDFYAAHEVDINQAARACDALLLEWAEHPDVPLQENHLSAGSIPTLSVDVMCPLGYGTAENLVGGEMNHACYRHD